MADNEVNQDVIRGEAVPIQQEQDDQVNSQAPPAGQPDAEAPAPLNPPAPIQAPPPDVEDSDSESEEGEQQIVHRGSHLQAPTHEVVWHYTQRFGIQALLWIQFLWNLLSYMATTTQTITKGVVRSLQDKSYVFFEGSNYPYRAQDLSLTGPGVAPVEWYYDADKKLFVSASLYNTTTEYTSNHLEWLCGQIRYNNLTLYDISDFLQQTKWAGRTKPSVARVLAAWSLQSGVILSGIEGITLQTINEDGTESTLTLRG